MRQRSHVKMVRIVSLSLCAAMLFSFANALNISNPFALEGEQSEQTKAIVLWSLAEKNGVSYREDSGRWEIAASGITQSSPLTREGLESLLPKELTVQVKPVPNTEPENESSSQSSDSPSQSGEKTGNANPGAAAREIVPGAESSSESKTANSGTVEPTGSPQALSENSGSAKAPVSPREEFLTADWDLSAFPKEGAYRGEYTVQAVLPEGYMMAQGEAAPSVTVVLPAAKQRKAAGTIASYDELTAAITAAGPNTPTVITVGGDLSLGGRIVIPTGKDIILVDDGEERTILSSAASKQFEIQEGGRLTLSSSQDGKLLVDGSGVGGQMNRSGGVIHCNGTFILDGADICNTEPAGNSAGVVYISGERSLFELKSGEIRDNRINGTNLSSNNATVHATSGATVKISGGKITNNRADDDDSDRYITAGLFARNWDGDVTIEMTGGEISNNISSGKGSGGGGVWLCGNSRDPQAARNGSVTMTMSGDARIIGNTAYAAGGGVFLLGNASFTMEGGVISQNSVMDGMGGGVATSDYARSTVIAMLSGANMTWEDYIPASGADTEEGVYLWLVNAMMSGPLGTFDSLEQLNAAFHTSFEMLGGTISQNTAGRIDPGFGRGDGGCGGGIYAASNNVALRGGEISGNRAQRQGGGVYVGSTPYTLFLYDALVTQNSAELLGGGMWLCPTGSAQSYVEKGGSIFENTCNGAGDDIASLPKAGGAELSLTNRLLGNWLVHWYEDGAIEENSGDLGLPVQDATRYPNTPLLGGLISSAETLALKAIAAQEGKDLAKSQAKLVLRDNSAPRGGGIGSNGTVIFNQYPIEYPTVAVSVTKQWAAEDTGHPESVTVYLYQDGEKIDETVLSSQNNWSFTFRDLPKYQNNALEQDAAKTPSQYTISEKAIDGYTSTITSEAGNEYAFTIYNRKEVPAFGNLLIQKVISGDASEPDREFHFTVSLSDTTISGTYGDITFQDGTASITLKGGEHKTANGLPAGIAYTVVEAEANQDGYTTTAQGDSGTILKDETQTALFTNTKTVIPPPEPSPDSGSLTISKTVSGSSGETGQKFTFTIKAADSAGAPLSGPFSYSGSSIPGIENPKSGTVTFSTNGTAGFELSHGQSVTITGLPAGTKYRVDESNNAGYTVSTSEPNQGTIRKETESKVSFQNHRDSELPFEPPESSATSGSISPAESSENPGSTVPSGTPHTGDDQSLLLSAILLSVSLCCFVGLSAAVQSSKYRPKHLKNRD